MVFSYQSKTTTRQMLNLCIPMMPSTPDLVVLLWCENTIRRCKGHGMPPGGILRHYCLRAPSGGQFHKAPCRLLQQPSTQIFCPYHSELYLSGVILKGITFHSISTNPPPNPNIEKLLIDNGYGKLMQSKQLSKLIFWDK